MVNMSDQDSKVVLYKDLPEAYRGAQLTLHAPKNIPKEVTYHFVKVDGDSVIKGERTVKINPKPWMPKPVDEPYAKK